MGDIQIDKPVINPSIKVPWLTYCQYCSPFDENGQEKICYGKQRGPIYCTRQEGHSGPHVACGSITHAIAVWEKEED